jgi:hypothetical protein
VQEEAMHVRGKLAVSIVVLSGALFAQGSSLMGTWKLNLAKSEYHSGPPPRSVTVRYQPYRATGVRITVNTVDARGILTHVVYTAQYDGKDYAVKGDFRRDTVALRRIDSRTTELTNKERGEITTFNTIVLSEDGRTRTVTVRGKNARGQPVTDLVVFDKQ